MKMTRTVADRGRLAAICLGGMLLGLVAEATQTIDILVAYDLSAQQELTGQGLDLNSFAQANVDKMNLCLENSGLLSDFSFRLVGTTTVSVDTSADELMTILSAIGSASSSTAAWKPLWQAREANGADLISFVTGGAIKNFERGLGYTLLSNVRGTSESAGRSALNNRAFQEVCADKYCYNVVALAALQEAGDYTMAHECAHNIGCGHPNEAEFYSFSQGLYFGSYVTVMGYADESHVVAPVFSSPSVTYAGLVTGGENQDNVRTLRDNYSFVAAYRTAKNESSEGSTSEDSTEGADAADADDASKVFFAKGVTFAGVCRDAESNLIGSVQLKVAATNKKKLTSKVSGSILLVSGKKATFKAKTTLDCSKANPEVVCTSKDLGEFTLKIAQDGFSGAFATGGLLTAEPVGGNLTADANGRNWFDFGAVPAEIAGAEVQMDFLPATGESFVATGTKWTFAKAATVKFKKNVLDQDALDKGIARGKTNLSALKLTYAAKTGAFKGSFSIYVKTAAGKYKKVAAKVTGLVVNGGGTGLVTVKGASGWSVTIR